MGLGLDKLSVQLFLKPVLGERLQSRALTNHCEFHTVFLNDIQLP